MVVPGSGKVKDSKPSQEGLRSDLQGVLGFDWREPGCSMCLAMNPDKLEAGRTVCASTSNRNFEGRQGKGGRTHLVSARRWPLPPQSQDTSSISVDWDYK